MPKPASIWLSKEKIKDRAKAAVIQVLGLEEDQEITNETNFVNDMNADSLDLVELVMQIEEEFADYDLIISDVEAEKIQTFGAMIEHLVKYRDEYFK